MTPPPIDYYDVLNSQPSDTIDDIKKSYQALVLKHHPDKQCASNGSNEPNDIQQFYQIDEAWKILRDPDKRKKYDAEMLQHKFDDEPIVHAKVYRRDFQFDEATQSYVYPCRCGGAFLLPDDCIESSSCDSVNGNNSSQKASAKENDADEEEIYIECDECSFVIQLLSNR